MDFARSPFAGELETHWTFVEDKRRTPERVAAIAEKHGLKVTHVVLDRGKYASQPMFTRRRRSTLAVELAEAQSMSVRLGNDGMGVHRLKIEAAVDNADVPQEDEDVGADPTRCFEHHVRVRLSQTRDRAALLAIAEAHGAHLSRNAWRGEADGEHERFVTQRCYGVGLSTARRELDRLLAGLVVGGFDVVGQQQEYVVYDSNLGLDTGWLPGEPPKAGKRAWYPNTFHAVAADESVTDAPRPERFDPALKHFRAAFRKGDPSFAVPAKKQAFRVMRRRALEHVLRAVASSTWSELLVLRGSVLLETWLGEAAREPGDMDWVVDPPSLTATSEDAVDMLRAIVELVARSTPEAGPALATDDVAIDAIWTYERAEGRRLVFPWSAPGLPSGAVQLDFVFQEPLAEPPRRVELVSAFGPPIPVRAATPELSLAWKLLWLATDMHPQGKDLYDATLLAEKFTLPHELLAKVLHSTGDGERVKIAADMPMGWNVEWDHLQAEMPEVKGTLDEWKARLAKALARSLG